MASPISIAASSTSLAAVRLRYEPTSSSSRGLAPEDVPDEPDEVLFESIRRFKGMEREVVVLVELPTAGDRLDELLYVGLTRATTELVVIAPPELVRRLGCSMGVPEPPTAGLILANGCPGRSSGTGPRTRGRGRGR